VNRALDHVRRRRRQPDGYGARSIADVLGTAPSPLPDAERLITSADWRRRVAAAMDTMSPLERITFALRHFEGKSIADIAETVGIGRNAAKQHVFRAVRKIRLALAPHWSGR
jgi:RNA polymerase sigma-70 factor (ECF subfamily)